MTADELQEAKAQLARLRIELAPAIAPKVNLTEADMGEQTRRGKQQVKQEEYQERGYHADYTETMSSATLIAIRNSIMREHPSRHMESIEGLRFRRITQVLRSRGMQNLEDHQ